MPSSLFIPKFRNEKLRQLAAAVERLSRFTVGPGFELAQGSAGTRLQTPPKFQLQIPADKPVCIVKAPTASSLSLTVREVRYRHFPPQAKDHPAPTTTPYEWAGVDFFAYPDFGTRADEYADSVWTGEAPTFETKFFLARRIDSSWVLLKPAEGGTPIQRVVITSVGLNHLVCRSYDFDFAESDEFPNGQEVIGEEDILVAKPFLLRRNGWSNPTFVSTVRPSTIGNFVYPISKYNETATERESTGSGSTETQVVVPSYQPRSTGGNVLRYPGDQLWIIKASTGVMVGTGEEAVEIQWLDLNVDSRAWARKFNT